MKQIIILKHISKPVILSVIKLKSGEESKDHNLAGMLLLLLFTIDYLLFLPVLFNINIYFDPHFIDVD